MENIVKIILVFIIIGLILLFWFKIPKKNNVEKLITINDVPHIIPSKSQHKVNPNFIEAQFHQDYMDVTTAFNNISPNQRQIFNINNIPCKVTNNMNNEDIEEVGKMATNFIDAVNENIRKEVPLVHAINSGWDEVLPEHTEKSGWEKVQESLGLPTSLYNKPKLNTRVHLVQFSDIVKYETESEIKYTCKIIISKDQVKDKLIIKVSFVHPKEINDKINVILETISVVGFLTTRGLGTDKMPMDDFYNFDSLEKNNMITGKTVETELMKKYKLRRNIMQEQIDNMDEDVYEKYKTSPTNADYESYKVTQTIFDDMNNNKKYD
jgi:hypothetical protein